MAGFPDARAIELIEEGMARIDVEDLVKTVARCRNKVGLNSLEGLGLLNAMTVLGWIALVLKQRKGD